MIRARRSPRPAFGPKFNRSRLFLHSLEERTVPASLVVLNSNDSGADSLRAVMATADTNGQDDTITFAPAVTAINLTTGQISLTTENFNLMIDGGGTVTINGAAAASATNRIFNFNVAGGNPTITLKGLTLAGGNLTAANNGGAILANNDPLVLNGVTFNNNKTAATGTAGGGAISLGAATTLTVTNSTFTGNSSAGSASGIHIGGASTVLITGSTFTSNTATGVGGVINPATGASTLTIDGCSFTSNQGSTGGVINGPVTGTTFNLKSSTFTSNTSTGAGGALYTAVQTIWQIDQCQFINNKATGVGGAIRMTSTSPTFNVNSSVFSGNNCTTNGGAIYFTGATTPAVTINNSTFSSNTAGSSGGALHIGGTVNTYNLNNCTLSGNVANGNTTATGGGAINLTSTVILNINNCTIVNNTATGLSFGGGIRRATATGTTNVISSIVAKNTAGTNPDMSFSAAVTVNGGANLVGVADVGNFTLSTTAGSNQTGTLATPLDPVIGPLVDNGGATLPHTLTHKLLSGSPGVNNGNQNGFALDQTGAARPSTGADIGSVESNPSGPIPPNAKATLPNVTTAGGTVYLATVNYTDDIGINTGSIDVNDVTLSGPGFGTPAVPTKASFTGSGTSVTATYEFTPPGGSWDALDDGKFTLTMVANQVFDTDGPAPVFPGTIGTFTVAIPLPPLVVDNGGDTDDGIYTAGQLTLREAINLSNNAVGSQESISFAAALNGTTITLNGELPINDPLIITGPGPNNLTIAGAGVAATTNRHFNLTGAPAASDIRISGLTLTGALCTTAGGSILVGDESLTLTNCAITGNSSASFGGGVHVSVAGSSLTVRDCTFSNNTSTGGGAIAIIVAAPLLVEGSTFVGNVSTIGNSGGAIRYTVAFPANGYVIRNSTFTGNSTTFNGGALGFSTLTGTAVIQNCTIVGNSVSGTGGGGGIGVNSSGTGTISLESTILADNLVTGTGAGPDLFFTTGTVTAAFSLIGSSVGATNFVPDATTTGLLGMAPLLGSLANNGGPTQTFLPQAGSPVFNNGSNPATLSFDQRGSGFPRVLSGTSDIGAVESINVTPTAKATSPNVPPDNATQIVTVVYTDETGINTGGIDLADIRLTGPGYSTPEAPTAFNITVGMNGDKSITVEYTFTPPGGSWDWTDNGKYTVQMQANQVFDTDAIPNSVGTGPKGSFAVAVALPVLVVDNTGDTDDGNYTAGQLTLREAVNLTNGSPGTNDSITFAMALANSTITVNSELPISDQVTITGFGSTSLTLSGNSTNRLFNINVAAAGAKVNLSGLTLANAIAASGTGGAISLIDEVLTLGDMVFSTNSITGSGGAIGATSAGAILNISNSKFMGNSASTSGGAINLAGAATVTLTNAVFDANIAKTTGGAIQGASTVVLNATDCTFSNNTGTSGGALRFASVVATSITLNRCLVTGNTGSGLGGGLYMSTSGNLTINDSTFSKNTGAGGGAIRVSSVTTVITNSTLSSNTSSGTTATTGGGAFLNSSTPALTIRNSTITNNESANATSKGGGVFISSTAGTMTISSTIVAGNTNPNQRDISASGLRSVAGDNNLFGAINPAVISLTGTNTAIGSEATPLDPLLDVLANNGGPTPTHTLKSGSPAINAGNNNAILSFDQRGTGFNRVVGLAADIGAVESPFLNPVAKSTLTNVTTAGGTVYIATVTYQDETGINTASIDINDVTLSGGNYGAPVSPTKASFTGSGTTVTATYEFTPPGGSWDVADNGIYGLNQVANQVFDTDGPNAVAAGPNGYFGVAIPIVYTVDLLGDIDDGLYGVGQLTFREAIGRSNASPGLVDTIQFDPALFNQTIIVSGGELAVSDAVNIVGPGAAKIALSGNFTNRLLNLSHTGFTSTISGVTIRDSVSTAAGGAIVMNSASLTLMNVIMTNNACAASSLGGAINLGAATLKVFDSTLSSNTGGTTGGGVIGTGTGVIEITRSTLSGNTSGGAGSAVLANGAGSITIIDSTVSNNSSSGTTGGAVATTTGTITVTNSTISGNSAANAAAVGGGIRLSSGKATVTNSTITNNLAGGGGSGIGFTVATATISIVSSIVAQNNDAVNPDLFSSVTGSSTVTLTNSILGAATDTDITLNQTASFVGTLATPVDAKLAALANNGGSTDTHALLAGSPALNAGSNTLTLANDQRGTGFARVSGGQTDIGAFEVQQAAAKVLGVAINSTLGTAAEKAQRSRVLDVAITFDSPVTFVGTAAAAFTLDKVGGGSITLGAAVSGGGTVVTLTFSGAGVDFTSLADGRYALHALAAQFAGAGLDGDGNGTGGDNFIFDEPAVPGTLDTAKIFRIFGDYNGDGTVAAGDFIQFRLALGGNSLIFDFDNDTAVAASDFIQFRLRFGGSI